MTSYNYLCLIKAAIIERAIVCQFTNYRSRLLYLTINRISRKFSRLHKKGNPYNIKVLSF
jgi:hypothetical protein